MADTERKPFPPRSRIERLRETASAGVCGLCAGLVVLLGAMLYLCLFGADRLDSGAWLFLEGFLYSEFPAQQPSSIAWSFVAASLAVFALAMFLAVCCGVSTAVFLSEYCGRSLRHVLKVTVELLAAIPTIAWVIVGFIAIPGGPLGAPDPPLSIVLMTMAAVVALMSVPFVCSIAEDALRAVPDHYREAAEALGASRLDIVWRVLFPAAASGLLAATALGVGRAATALAALLLLCQFWPFPAADTTAANLFALILAVFCTALATNIGADILVRGLRGSTR